MAAIRCCVRVLSTPHHCLSHQINSWVVRQTFQSFHRNSFFFHKNFTNTLVSSRSSIACIHALCVASFVLFIYSFYFFYFPSVFVDVVARRRFSSQSRESSAQTDPLYIESMQTSIYCFLFSFFFLRTRCPFHHHTLCACVCVRFFSVRFKYTCDFSIPEKLMALDENKTKIVVTYASSIRFDGTR